MELNDYKAAYELLNFTGPLSKERFFELMTEISKYGAKNEDDEDFVDVESRHCYLDRLMAKQLSALGFDDAIKVFDETDRWYA